LWRFSPWGNLDTAFAGIEQMNKGSSTESILQIMKESSLIQKNKIAPKDAKFVNASHYAQRGSKSLGELKGLAARLSKMTKEEKIELLESVGDENPIPEELKQKSVIIQPKDKLTGCAISDLRRNGLIYTALDLQTEAAKRNKYAGLLSNVNMGVVIKEQDDNLRKAKKNGYRILASMGQGELAPRTPDPRSVMKEYYEVRKDFTDITAFSYSGEIRIFKSSDVLKYYESQGSTLRDEISAGMHASRNYRISQKGKHEKARVEYQIDWMESGEITELFDGELPPGIGSDDARILRKISLQIAQLQRQTVFIIMTDDKKMINKLNQLATKHMFVEILSIGKEEYLIKCLQNYKLTVDEIPIYNALTGRDMSFKGLSTTVGLKSTNWRTKPQYQLIWDFPNYERGIEPVKYDRKEGKLTIPYGGFLRRDTIKNDPSWVIQEWKNFKKRKDFKINERFLIRERYRANKHWF